MDDDQTPVPSEPWVSHSAWAFAPALFFYELVLAFAWLFTLGIVFDLLFVLITMLPAAAYFVYLMGIKCATEETAPKVPRKRIWGTSLLVAIIDGFFIFLVASEQFSTVATQHPDEFKKLMDPLIESGLSSGAITAEEAAQLGPMVFASQMALVAALMTIVFVFVLHVISLWVGVRSVEKVRR